MINSPNKSFLELIGRYLDNDLTESDASILADRLETDDKTVDLLLECLLADSLLSSMFQVERNHFFPDLIPDPCIIEDNWNDRDPNVNTTMFATDPIDLNNKSGSFYRLDPVSGQRIGSGFSIRSILGIRLIIGGLSLCLLFGILFSLLRSKSIDPLPFDHGYRSVARIGGAIDPVWKQEVKQYKPGQGTGTSKIHLENGLVKLDFDNGAKIILDGPGELTINGTGNVHCDHGDLSIHVPSSAIGFEVVSPFGTFIDRGTDFALSIQKDRAEIQMIKGKVDLMDNGSIRASLKEGDQLSIDAGRNISIRPSKAIFISEADYRKREIAFLQKEEEKVRKADLVLDSGKDLLVRFDFNDLENDRIPNRSSRGKDRTAFAENLGAQSDKGSFPNRNALRISSVSRRVRFNLDGQYRSMTISANVRIDQLRHEGNIFFISDQFQKEDGAFLWQITREGRLQFQITQKNSKQKRYFETPIVFTPDLLKTWTQFTLVIDGQTGTISNYIDGNCVSSEKWIDPIPLVVGTGYIGNAALNMKGKNNRYLDGLFQNFSIHDTVLPPEIH